MQEKINMTPETKCIQTIFVVIAAIIIVVINKEMFFETKHVGNLLEEKIMNREINSYANNRAQVIKKQLPIIDNCNYDLQTGFRQLN